MKRVPIKDVLVAEQIGQSYTVFGWVRTKRESKGIAFLAISDGSSQDILQLFISGESPAFQKLQQCTTGAAIGATGVLRASPARGQSVELDVAHLSLFGAADPIMYRLQKKRHSLDFLREVGHLRPPSMAQ